MWATIEPGPLGELSRESLSEPLRHYRLGRPARKRVPVKEQDSHERRQGSAGPRALVRICACPACECSGCHGSADRLGIAFRLAARYSVLSAITGEIEAARKAGIIAAKNAQTARALDAKVRASGSHFETP